MQADEFQWRPTTAPPAGRYDDIYFIDAATGWAVNSNGQILKTTDGFATWEIQEDLDAYLRSVGFATAEKGWVGTTTEQTRLYQTLDGGAAWTLVQNLPPLTPVKICGIAVVDEQVVYASGTNVPSDTARMIKTTDGGATWSAWDMSAHAKILIDCYFPQRDRGWVVGGKQVGPLPGRAGIKPVVLFTEDGGQTWVNRLEGQEDDFPLGEWGWKIHFVNDDVAFISLENLDAGAVLKTTDGGQTWERKVVNDPQQNKNLEGIGFLSRTHGWVGGWGDRKFTSGKSSSTVDGGDNWQDANEIGRFINRFRLVGEPLEVAYASGRTIYKYSPEPIPTPVAPALRLIDSAEPVACGCLSEVSCTITQRGAKSLRIDVWDSFGAEVGCMILPNPSTGRHAVPATMLASVATQPERGHFVVRFTVQDAEGERRSESLLVTREALPLNRFSRIKVFLDEGVEGNDIAAHGPFWRGTSRDEFVDLKVFGVDLVRVGDGAGSNLVRALRGEGFDRMPRGFPPLPDQRIALIEKWIDDGAPSELSDMVTVDSASGSGLDPVLHNHYWREFDNWAAFHRPDGVMPAIGLSFQVARVWANFVRGTVDEQVLLDQINEPDTAAAITLLANRQMRTIEAHYGNPVPLLNLLESYELFGRGIRDGGLPEDPLRAGDPHQMNGPQMWFNWSAMADACLRLDPPIQPVFWHGHIRAILLGLMNDGVFRGRFPVDGFLATDQDVSRKMREYVLRLTAGQLQDELASRYRRTSLNLPFG